jgi:hypothetical protein
VPFPRSEIRPYPAEESNRILRATMQMANAVPAENIAVPSNTFLRAEPLIHQCYPALARLKEQHNLWVTVNFQVIRRNPMPAALLDHRT